MQHQGRHSPLSFTSVPGEAAQLCPGPHPRLAAAIAFLLAFAMFLPGVAPTISWRGGGADSGELAAAVAAVGVAHPPGYPLFVILGQIARPWPIGELAWRLGLLSALWAALAVAATAWSAALLLPHGGGQDPVACWGALLAPILAALFLATGPTLWSQAIIVEVYALNAAAVALALAALLSWQRGGRRRALLLAAGCAGAALGNHLTAAALLPAIALAVAQRKGSRPEQIRALALAAAPVLLLALFCYGFLYLRALAQPALTWGDPSTPARLLDHVTARSYQAYLGSEGGEAVALRLLTLPPSLAVELTPPALALALLGMVASRRSAALPLFLVVGALNLAFAAVYVARDDRVYLIPVALALAPWIAVGLAHLLRWLVARGHTALAPALLGAACALAPIAYALHRPAVELHGTSATRDAALHLLLAQRPDGVLWVEGDEPTFALWYAQIALGVRPDVAVVNPDLWSFEWYRAQLRRRYPTAPLPPEPQAADAGVSGGP